MPCRNAAGSLKDSIASVLAQPECLELLVADNQSSDGSLEILQEIASRDPRLRVVSSRDQGPADGLNHALLAARGTHIGWLHANALYARGSLARACAALAKHPDWLMVYGEDACIHAESGSQQRYPTLPPQSGRSGFLNHCFISEPTVVFRRSMALMLGPLANQWGKAYALDYWLRAFRDFPQRIGWLPHVQAHSRLHSPSGPRLPNAAEILQLTALLAHHFGTAPSAFLEQHALTLHADGANRPADHVRSEHLAAMAARAEPWLAPVELAKFRHRWLLDPTTAPALLQAEERAEALALPSHLPVRLLQALHPELQLDAPGPPAGPHRRLQTAVQEERATYPLLRAVAADPHQRTNPGFAASAAAIPFDQRPFGVNLIGYAFEVFGIGEDIRMAALALEAAAVPCCVIHHPAGNGAACSDRTLEPLLCTDPAGGPYAFNLICMTAPSQARWLLHSGLEGLRERYTMAAWPWETRQWPRGWLPLLEVADELWPSSHFTASALKEPAAAAGLPLQVMPMAAEVPNPQRFCLPAARQSVRASHGLPTDAVVFAYGFDLNSTTSRKNPMAALEAFQRAFPLPGSPSSDNATIPPHPLCQRMALMIKTFQPQRFSADWYRLQCRAAEDPRIHLVVATLDREALLALYGCCDVFLSLHRSEGFGRSMAEALQLGMDVIATAYGGSRDFLLGPLAHPLRFQEVPIPRGAYPWAEGHVWAEPDDDHAVERMREVGLRRLALLSDPAVATSDPSRDPDVLSRYRALFSSHAAGNRYRVRLEELWAQRSSVATSLRWRADTEASCAITGFASNAMDGWGRETAGDPSF